MVREYSEKKVNYFARMTEMLGKYRRLIFCNVDNVKSQQMHNIRKGLRGKGEVLMGKNTLMRKVITARAEAEGASELDLKLFEAIVTNKTLVGNLGIIFTNEDFSAITSVIKTNRIQAPARVGAVAPMDVTIPAGNTGLEPGATSFFQALQINTKIVKGAVEIVTEKKVLNAGDKVDNSTAVLLQKLNIKPFFYGLDIKFIYDNGAVFGAEILELNDDFFRSNIQAAVTNIAALSLATGIPTEASLPHVVTLAFKNLLSISLGTAFTFDEFNGKSIVEAVKSGKALGGPAPAAAAPAAPAGGKAAPAPKAAAPPPEEDDDMGLGLFD
jgi:large subunit ribosomal protein LP0